MQNPHPLSRVQIKIAATAEAMLSGDMNYLAGAIRLEELRHELGAYENDPDFLPFIAILSEVDRLGLNRDPYRWKKALSRARKAEIEESIAWAKEISLAQCESLVLRYSKK